MLLVLNQEANQYTFELTLPSSHLNYIHQPAIIFKDHHNEFYNITQSKCAGLCKDSKDTRTLSVHHE